MSLFRGDASEFYNLATDLSSVGAKAVPALRSAMAEGGRAFAQQWSSNASDVLRSDGHAFGYPKSIDSELVFDLGGVSVDVGPNTAKKHGFLGRVLENGAEHSPPYLFGIKAMSTTEPVVEELVASVVAGTFLATPVANASELKAYTTKAGKTRMATQAQIDNWTRGSQ